MKHIFLTLFSIFLLLSSPLFSDEIETLYQRLDPTSIKEHLAFYKLYKTTTYGEKSLNHAWKLLLQSVEHTENVKINAHPPLLFPESVDSFIALIQPSEKNSSPDFSISDEALQNLEKITKHLKNRQLKGFVATTKDELLQLSPEEVDIAHAIFLLQFGQDEKGIKKVKTYEASIDLMALQILARCPLSSTACDKVRAINQLIFFEMGFRFPPQSTYSETIDHFTFLPQVLESRRGVCLGVSTLYLAIAQRIGLQLHIITPPGHIFLSLQEDDKTTNIETTMRGVHIPSDEYLGLSLKALPKRNLKEVIGMSYVNLASTFLSQGKWDEAAKNYEEALYFMPEDSLVHELLGSTYFIQGKKAKATHHLKIAKKNSPKEYLSSSSVVDDILNGKVCPKALEPYFLHVDEKRSSLEKKYTLLQESVTMSPAFRQGLFSLASVLLQLRRKDQALAYLEKLRKLDTCDLSLYYYLAALYVDRYNEPEAIECLKIAKKIASTQNFYPPQLREIEVCLQLSK